MVTDEVAPDLEEREGQDNEDTPHEKRDEGVVEGEQQHQHEGQLAGVCGRISDPVGEMLVLGSPK